MAAGEVNITINATIANDMDLETVALRVAQIFNRRG
jgi:hypothetical protein